MSKNCPLLNIGRTDQSVPCQKDVCEWWDTMAERCGAIKAPIKFSLKMKEKK